MKKLYLTRILKLAALLFSIAAVVLLLQNYLFFYTDHDVMRIHNYSYEEPDSIDVLVFGASDTYAGVNPGYAYDQFGFTSHIYSTSNNTGLLYKNMLIEALKNQKPRLILVEVEGFVKDWDMLMDESRIRLFAEGILMSRNKLDTIFSFPTEEKLSHLLPFVKYHGNWIDPQTLRTNFEARRNEYNRRSVLKGILSYTHICEEPHLYDITQDMSTKELLEPAQEALIEFLEYCRSEQLNVVFVRFPHKLIDEYCYERYQNANKVEEIVTEYGFPFHNMERRVAEIGIDYETDYFDSDHLNIFGQRKLTDYLGKLILEEYNFEPITQTPENKAHWDECALYANAYLDLGEEYFANGEDSWMIESPWLMNTLKERIHMAQE